jgi:carboxymethylenebutenolidase
VTAETSQPPVRGLIAEPMSLTGHNGDAIPGYLARPLGEGPFPGVVVIHEAFGMVQHTRELVHKFAAAGYLAIAPDLYSRLARFEPTDMPRVMEAMNGLPDSQALGDLNGAVDFLRARPEANGKVGAIGHCSGGRHTMLLAASGRVDAAVDCYGGGVVTEDRTEARPQPMIEMFGGIACPVLGLFGEGDRNPNPDHVAAMDAELNRLRKPHEFYTYPAPVGHGFFADYRPSYNQEAAADGWQRIFAFFGEHLR